jgi:hypothetical protein
MKRFVKFINRGEHYNLPKRAINRPLLCWPLLIFLVLSFPLVETSALGAENVEATSNSFPVTFESFLTNPPVIEDAEYVIINNAPSPENFAEFKRQHPATIVRVVLTNYCTLRLDQTNYILSHPTVGRYSGKFGNTQWMLMGGILRFADMQMNTSQGVGPAVGFFQIQQANIFMSLGLNMVPNTIKQISGTDRFTAQWEPQDTSDISANETIGVQFQFKDGIPLTASTTNPIDGHIQVNYRYGSNFFNGSFPIGFDVMALGPHGSKSRLISVQINKLEISQKHLKDETFDPRIVLKGKYRGFILLSNNVAYGMNGNHLPYRVMSAVEARQNAARFRSSELGKHYPLAAVAIRGLLIATVLAPICVILVRTFRKRNNVQ